MLLNSNQVDVSIIIVNWNTRELLRACLASVFSESRGLVFEVFVVDNASADGSADMVRRDFPAVMLIENAANVGFAAANNQAMRVAQGRYVLLLNSDTIVLDGAIQKTVVFSDRFPDAAVVGCRVLNGDGSLQHSCSMFPSLLGLLSFSFHLDRLFPRSRFLCGERMVWWDHDCEREIDVVSGCYMLVRRGAIEEVGMLDDGFFMYAEETDWCFRMKSRGWKIMFTPQARIIHFGGGSAPKFSARRARITNASHLRYFGKHWSQPKALVGRGLIALFYAIRLAALWPKRAFSRELNELEAKRFENHWAGLKDVMARRAAFPRISGRN